MIMQSAAGKRHKFWNDQRGETNVLTIPLILAAVLLLAAIGFGAWSFSSREDYRVNVEQKIGVAVKEAKQEEGIAKDKEHAEADKLPLKPYQGPEAYGGISVQYPKTWSGYVSASGSSAMPVDGYFHPGVVPGTGDKSAAYALRIQVVNQAYSRVVASLDADVKSRKVTAAAYAFPKVPKIVGVRFDGAIGGSSSPIIGSLVLVPLRDKTIKIWTESPQYVTDFNTHVLPNITFSP